MSSDQQTGTATAVDVRSGVTAIDADTHVIESEATWRFYDGPEDLRPVLNPVRDAGGGVINRWLIDGTLVPHPPGKGGQILATPPVLGLETGDASDILWEWRSLDDPVGRVEDAKRRGTDTQVIYPTLFIAFLTRNPDLEAGLCRSYNRFLADSWAKTGGKLRWVIAPPLLSVDVAIEEVRFGKDHGATGVLFRGMEGDRSVADPYFYPIYEEASRLGLPICIHTGPGCPALTEIADTRYTRVFGAVRMLPLIAFHDLMYTKTPEMFPELRFGFIEAAASWVPYLLHYLRRTSRRLGGPDATFGPQLFEENRLFVASEVDEDIPYLANAIGWDHILIGSDYGHEDQSAELDLVAKIGAWEDLDETQRQLLLQQNARDFYGI